MNTELLQSLIDEDYGYRHEGRNWGRSLEHSSLVINEEEQRWYWNSKGIGGDALEYLIQVRGMRKQRAKELLAVKNKIAGYSEDENSRDNQPYDKLVDLLWTLGKTNRGYWYKRMLTDSTIDRHRLGFYNGWYLIPLYVGSNFVNFQCRREEPTRMFKYWYSKGDFKPVLMNSTILDLVNKVYITEGVVDSLLLNQEGIPSVASTGGSGYWDNAWFPLFYKTKEIYYIADNDGAGKYSAKLVANSLGVDKVKIYLFENKPEKYDTVNYFQDGGNSKDFKESVESESKYLFEIGELNDRQKSRKTDSVFRRVTRKSKRGKTSTAIY